MTRLFVTCAVLAVLASCGPEPRDGAGRSVSSALGVAGGTLSLPAGTSVTVPPLALASTVEVTLTEYPGERPPFGLALVATPIRLEPKGLTLGVPVSVTMTTTGLPAGAALDAVVILRGDFDAGSQSFVPMPTTVAGPAQVATTTEVFADFLAVWVADGATPFGACGDTMCLGGESCSTCPLDCGLCTPMTDGGVDAGPLDAGGDAATDGGPLDVGTDSAVDGGVALAPAEHRIASYGSSTCAVVNGAVVCWGSNVSGQLGVGGTPTVPGTVTLPMAATAVGLSSGAGFAVLADGTLYGWGTDTSEVLGSAAPGAPSAPIPPTSISGITDAADVVGNWYNVCVRHRGGTVSCWGDGTYGVIAPTAVPSEAPVVVAGITDAVELEAGDWNLVRYCARHATGRVTCWGGQTFTIDDMGIAGATELESVGNGFCAKVGTEWSCWGASLPSAVDGSARTYSTPTAIPDYGPFTVLGGVMVSGNSTMCGTSATGTTCAGTALSVVTTTTAWFPGFQFTELTSTGWSLGCGITAGGGVYCFGADGSLELGNDGSPMNSATPVAVLLP